MGVECHLLSTLLFVSGLKFFDDLFSLEGKFLQDTHLCRQIVTENFSQWSRVDRTTRRFFVVARYSVGRRLFCGCRFNGLPGFLWLISWFVRDILQPI